MSKIKAVSKIIKEGKVGTVLKALITKDQDLPWDEEWFQKRMEACSSCEYNSIIDKEGNLIDESLWDFQDREICRSGGHCKACTCCIKAKASVKSEICGLAQIQMAPKWGAIEVDVEHAKGFSLINVDTDKASISIQDKIPTLNFGVVRQEVLLFKHKIFVPIGYEFKTFVPSCTCTWLQSHSKVDENHYEFEIGINTENFKENFLNTKHGNYEFVMNSKQRNVAFAVKYLMVKKK